MLNEKHYHLFKQLKVLDTVERKEALVTLMELEGDEELLAEDFIELLNQDDPVLQQYAIEAIGRNRSEGAYQALDASFSASRNPILLTTMLKVFKDISSDLFFPAVKAKLEDAWLVEPKNEKPVHGSKILDQLFGEDELLDQILVPSLKYFQTLDSLDHPESLYVYLQHKNMHVRWNVLMVFNSLEISIEPSLLKDVKQKDTYAPNRELADIMLTKFSAP